MAAVLSQAVVAAAVTQQILGSLWSIVGTSWNTSWWVSSQDPTQVTLTFGTPAPAVGGTVYYTADFQIQPARPPA